jgi:PleD family two-component response regulator
MISSKKEKVVMEEVKQKGANDLIVVAITIVLLSIVAAVGLYELNDRKLMAANIENAIQKGIDPLTVRCSYVRDYDTICIAHAAASGRKF